MFEEIPLVFGFLLGLSLAMPPGPILAHAAQRGIEGGFRPCAVVGLGATAADGVLCLAMAFGFVQFLAGNDRLLSTMSVLGAGLMFFFARAAWRAAEGARRSNSASVLDAGVPSSTPRRGAFFAGFVLAISSPYNYAWWAGAGTALFDDYGAIVFVGFFSAIVAWVFVFAALVVWARSKVERVSMIVSYASAALLAGFAVLLAWKGITGLFPTSL